MIRQWLNRNGRIVYSAPCADIGDVNRSRVSWVCPKWKEEAKAYHLFCLNHRTFMCACIDQVITHRKNIGINDA